ncbi:hypothetical protein SAMN05421544_10498 [Riemerella columbipharyngis]|uniref:DUF1648 domain-containing protein n=1 Tax=Riemerella columbipharyngis TaxID=1071918 RepID=A0A1G7AUH9_9FLAO|nr:hypothetical protein SAMN05421544_10498 [Riemerella columbipharyngis]
MSSKIKLFLLPIGIVTLYTFFLLYNFKSLPDKISVYGYGDKVKFGRKIFVFFPILLNYLFLIFIGFLIKNPNKLNLPIKIDDDKERIYAKVQISLVVLCLLFVDVLCVSL